MDKPPEISRPKEQVAPVAESNAAPSPLGYESARDRMERKPRIDVTGFVFVFVVGFLATAVPVVYVSFVTGEMLSPVPRRNRIETVSIYAILLAVTIVLLVRTVTTPGWSALGRWLILGMLLGAGMTLLAGEICFLRL